MRMARSNRWRHVVGLTGGYGSGKSTVLKIFEKMGALTLDADEIVRDLLSRDTALKRKIIKLFGSRICDRKRQIHRQRLAALIFQFPQARAQLEGVIHPRVLKQMQKKLRRHRGRLAVCDVPLLYEKGWEKYFDRIVVVYARRATRLNRLKAKGLSVNQIKKRMKAQGNLERKAKRSDFVINNDGRRRQTRQKTKDVFQNIIQTYS
ncbi:MAG: dephospho-CoA kinase [Elusimicrobia bacterium]|nr:dephospho-CoA kinase [Candidatus Obscuribacterium magneticum]